MNTTDNSRFVLARHILMICSFVCVSEANAAGWNLYEMSAKAVGQGGAYAEPVDASANFYNAAGLAMMTGTVVTVGAAILAPRIDAKVYGHRSDKMNSGYFFVPNAFVSQELPHGFAMGLGAYVDAGLGADYPGKWPLSWNTVTAEMTSYTINPNIAYRITDNWSVGAGLRCVHMTFNQRRRLATYGYRNVELDADNDIDFGWNIGTLYRVCENFSLGLSYRSQVRCDLEGTSRGQGILAPSVNADVGDKLNMPMSATAGFTWDVAEPLHLNGAFTWTDWSCVDTLCFKLPSGVQTFDLDWSDALRMGGGVTYDITDAWSGSFSYIYDFDPTNEEKPQTMLPPGNRNIFSFGTSYAFMGFEISAAYMFILLENHSSSFNNGVATQTMETHRYLTHCICATISYQF